MSGRKRRIPEAATSKKVWATVLGVAIVVVGRKVGLETQTVNDCVYLLMTYIVGQGLADFGKHRLP